MDRPLVTTPDRTWEPLREQQSKPPADASALPRDDADLRAAEALARWMDHRMLDPVIGLVLPWGGDVASAALGLYPVVLAWRRGASRVLVARMLLNLSADLVGGLVPVVGDIWDFFFRAHSRNLALLRARRTERTPSGLRATWRDSLVIIGAALVFLAALAAPVVLVVLALRAVHR
jgi:hypothetical protein